MGGELRECGCYDGPLSENDMTLVSVRCGEHRGNPAIDGYVPMRRNSNGTTSPVAFARSGRRPAMATSIKTRKRKKPTTRKEP